METHQSDGPNQGDKPECGTEQTNWRKEEQSVITRQLSKQTSAGQEKQVLRRHDQSYCQNITKN